MVTDASKVEDSYRTLALPSIAESKVQGSKFLAFAYPVESAEEAVAKWKALKKGYHDATHHCFAFRLRGGGGEYRSNDDGEPAGTAGRPILGAIDHAGLTDIVIIVVRYFGGTKLGVGGLSRAYADAAGEAILSGTIVERFVMASLEVSFPHHLTSPVMRTIDSAGAQITGSSYDESAHLQVRIRASQLTVLANALLEATHAGATVTTIPPEP